ncbi:uncharacterized protein C8Q71DRAFT_781639 [Rhodofomes roseus]|uniref:Nucleoporin p58/p45 n=1 Tax=Rhodofomes roseus TaxID=34475 RepID=A0ABQ8K4R3_9APHY|nr:uncharacterized protein C8Q71DRAFT_781639 [Rhodofomes roseus]KAH9831611.1 hypothetical protein C8Q71DRAFT_781639 [Rhodofomes roseus]
MASFSGGSSAFGIKPANQTGSSLFGQPNQSNPQGSLFGSTNTQQQNTGLGAFGSQPQTQNQGPAAGSSLFGMPQGQNPNQQQNQNQPAQGTGLFGGNAYGQSQQPAQQPGQSTGLFGQTNTQQQAPSSGLFGQSNTNTNQPAPSGGLFGQSNANNQQQAPSGGLFGQSNANNQQQAPSGGLFGQPAANTQQGSTLGSSLFGNTQNQPQQPQQQSSYNLGAFGSSTTGPTLGQSTGLGALGGAKPGGGFGASTLGSSLSTAQASGVPPFTKSTKFNDLPDGLKKTFEDIDTFIQGRVQISNDLKQRKLGEEATKGQDDVRAVHKELVNAITTLHSDVMHMRDLKAKVNQTVQDTIVATHIVDGFRNPQQHGAYLKSHANFPLEFFMRVTEQMAERLRWYKTTIEQIERKLSSAAAQSQQTPQAISTTLGAQHATFVALASKTAALNAELQKIKMLYTQLWRQKTGSMRDPFNELDRGSTAEFGLESIRA